jgi:hypothetical protein
MSHRQSGSSKLASLASARAELAQVHDDADQRVRYSMERVFSEFLGATDRELRRALQHRCSPIRAQEAAEVEKIAASLRPADRKKLSAQTMDPQLLDSWQRK